MSIDNLSPLTQTPEQMTGEVTDVQTQLGREGARRVIVADDLTTETEGRLLYLPTHDSLQAGINRIREVELAKADTKLQEINDKVADIEAEIYKQKDHLSAIEAYIDDLGLSSAPGSATKRFNGYSYSDVIRTIQALEGVRTSLLIEAVCIVKKERSAALAEIEEIEQQDFELLQDGK